MNLKPQHVISNITGKTGMRIIEDIVMGERDPWKLAALHRSDSALGAPKDLTATAHKLTRII